MEQTRQWYMQFSNSLSFERSHVNNNCSFTNFTGLTCLPWLRLALLNCISTSFAKVSWRPSTKFLTGILKWSSTIFYTTKLSISESKLQSLRNVDFNLVMNHNLAQESIGSTGMLNTIFLNASYLQYNIVPVIFSYLFKITFFTRWIMDRCSFRFDCKCSGFMKDKFHWPYGLLNREKK